MNQRDKICTILHNIEREIKELCVESRQTSDSLLNVFCSASLIDVKSLLRVYEGEDAKYAGIVSDIVSKSRNK